MYECRRGSKKMLKKVAEALVYNGNQDDMMAQTLQNVDSVVKIMSQIRQQFTNKKPNHPEIMCIKSCSTNQSNPTNTFGILHESCSTYLVKNLHTRYHYEIDLSDPIVSSISVIGKGVHCLEESTDSFLYVENGIDLEAALERLLPLQNSQYQIFACWTTETRTFQLLLV